tara:strand:+ start:737 stop:1393 length:657 start_codon:yes stop_codon:yes gene_type:complete
MVSRTNTSKTIRRRTGGYAKKTGKGTTIKEINRMREDWIDDPDHTGTSPYTPKRKKYSPKRKNVQSPNPMGMSKKDLEQAKRKRRIKRLQKATAAAIDKGRTAREGATSAVSMRGVAVPRKAAVKKTDIGPPEGYTGRRVIETTPPKPTETTTMTADERAQKALDEKKRKRERGEYEQLFIEKTGGKLSRKKGGKVKKKRGGKLKLSSGSKFVASLYE